MTKLIHVVIAGGLMLLFGLATAAAPTEEEHMRALQTYGPACERAGFFPMTLDWARCATYKAGYTSSQSPETLEQRLMRLDGEWCQIAGFKVGTGAFGQCLLANAEGAQAQAQAIAAAFQQPAKPRQITMPVLDQVTCTGISAFFANATSQVRILSAPDRT